MANNEVTRRKRGGYAGTSEVERFAATLKTAHLECRELGHIWKPYTARFVPDQKCYERTLRCSRCLSERQELLDAWGGKLSNHYRYSDGYQHKGRGRIMGEGRDVLRLESVTRFIDKTG